MQDSSINNRILPQTLLQSCKRLHYLRPELCFIDWIAVLCSFFGLRLRFKVDLEVQGAGYLQ